MLGRTALVPGLNVPAVFVHGLRSGPEVRQRLAALPAEDGNRARGRTVSPTAPRSPLPAPRSPLPAPRSPLPAPRSPVAVARPDRRTAGLPDCRTAGHILSRSRAVLGCLSIPCTAWKS